MAKNTELMAFEDFYQWTNLGHKTTEAIDMVADKYGVSKRTVFRWRKDYNWEQLATERSVKVNQQLAEDIKDKSDARVKDFRKPFIGILNRLVAQCVHNNTVEIKSVKDLVLVIETINKLQKEMDFGTTQIISSEYSRTKHMAEINSVLKQLNEKNPHELEEEKKQNGEDDTNASGLHETEVLGD